MRVMMAAAALTGCVAAAAPSHLADVAASAIERLRAGDANSVWPLLRQGTDNTVRSLLVRDIARSGIGPEVILRRLETEAEVSARRALVLTLGGFETRIMSARQRDRAVRLVQRWFAADPDSGIHNAARWWLRERAGAAPPSGQPPAGARWSITTEGQTLAVLHGPASVRMGSPADEPGRQPASDSPFEPQHTVRIGRSFAIATTEVTVAEFRRFLAANPEVAAAHRYPDAPGRMAEVLARFSPDDDGPAIAVTWYEAAMYCNWLSAREGLAPGEWVYPTGLLADGMEMPPDYRKRTGYRLPTEAEWEMAARAGTTTARFFGSSPDLLPEYAWFARRPPRSKGDPVDPADPQRTSRVGALKPNDLGLFDVYGNVWEWTQDRVARFQDAAVDDDREDAVRRIAAGDARTRRGGAFPYGAEMARSAGRGTVGALPTNRRDNVGFRIARTVR